MDVQALGKTGRLTCALVAFALAAAVSLYLPSEMAFAADALAGGQGAAGGETALSTQKAKKALSKAKTSKRKASKRKVGNCDKFIGLGKRYMVFALGKVNVSIYKKASSKSRRITWYNRKSCVVVDTKGMKAGKNYKWVKVKLRGKQRGYVKLSQVKLVKIDTITFGLDTSKKKNKIRAKICRVGLKYMGVTYSERGGPISKGLDCGAFARYSYRKGGLTYIKRRDLGYLNRFGKQIPRSKLKPGDLVFYPSNGRYLGHAALYIGKGLISNSSAAFGHYYPRGGIRVSALNYRSPGPCRFRNIVGN